MENGSRMRSKSGNECEKMEMNERKRVKQRKWRKKDVKERKKHPQGNLCPPYSLSNLPLAPLILIIPQPFTPFILMFHHLS